MHFREQASKFDNGNAATKEIITAGEQALVALYKGKVTQSLDALRYERFCEKVASRNAVVQPQILPPTSAAAQYHSLRVYYQVQEWLGRASHYNVKNYGWANNDGMLIPITTQLDAAPQSLLQIIHCSCKTGCHTLRCSCRKNGVDCSTGCSECRGICENMTVERVLSDVESDTEEES